MHTAKKTWIERGSAGRPRENAWQFPRGLAPTPPPAHGIRKIGLWRRGMPVRPPYAVFKIRSLKIKSIMPIPAQHIGNGNGSNP
jgi:hypothetical protein